MFFLAFRHLLSRKRQTLLTLLGIILGTAAYVVISGMMLGFQVYIVDQLVNNDSHLRVSAREEVITEHSLDKDFFGDRALVNWLAPPSGRRDEPYISYPQGWFERLNADPYVIAYSPQMVTQALVNRAQVSLAARLIGSDPQRQLQVTNIEKYMLKGTFKEIGSSGNRIIVGKGLLDKLGARVPESIFISVGKSGAQPFKIVGTFLLGVKSIDDTTIFASLSDVQRINSTPSRISDIAIRLSDVTLASSKASEWAQMSQDKVQSWDQANEGIMSVFKTQDIVRNSMTISILIVAAFGIYNILSMAVNHKKREIAILRSMGYLPSDITKLFLIQGNVLGFLGGIVGCILGYFICLYMSTIQVSSSRGLGTGTMLVSFLPSIYVKGFFLAFLSSSFASLLPARAAGRMSPIEIIRSENE